MQQGRHCAAASAKLCALGFVEVTRRGRAGNGEFRRPNLFRLTYLPAYGKGPTHEWRQIETVEEAEKIAKKVRRTIKKHRKNRKPVPETPVLVSSPKTRTTPVTDRTYPPNTGHPENVPLSRQSSHLAWSGTRTGPTPSTRGGAQACRTIARDGEPVTFHRTNKRRTS